MARGRAVVRTAACWRKCARCWRSRSAHATFSKRRLSSRSRIESATTRSCAASRAEARPSSTRPGVAIRRRLSPSRCCVGARSRASAAGGASSARSSSCGRLQHPTIARLYEAGETRDAAILFFSMEFVRGVPMHEYARESAQPIADRLRLFGALCEGVAYAHEQGVVHRDLKPANVSGRRERAAAHPRLRNRAPGGGGRLAACDHRTYGPGAGHSDTT